jgi:hypothetical protein
MEISEITNKQKDKTRVSGKKYFSIDIGFLPKLDITNNSYSPESFEKVITRPTKYDIGNTKNNIFGIVYI